MLITPNWKTTWESRLRHPFSWHWEGEGADSSAGGVSGAGSALREETESSFKSEERQQPSWDVPGHPPWHGQQRTLRVCPAALENSE